MMRLALAAAASLVFILLYAWQDGVHPCNDGDRYTSKAPQPAPFNRRFCGWPKPALQACSFVCLLGLGVAMGDWTRATLLLSLPGAWFIATHPTTVDAPSMLLAYAAGALWPTQPACALFCSLVSGLIHERGPVFAAVYGWTPWLLLGLVAGALFWRKAAGADKDALVPGSTVGAIFAHRPYQDWLDARVVAMGLRGLLPFALWFGVSPSAWGSFALAMGSRLVGSDTCRFLFWCAPAIIRDLPDLPWWMIAAHVATFRRAI